MREAGFEPSTPGVEVQCANHYTIEAYLLTKEYRTLTPILFETISLSLFLV